MVGALLFAVDHNLVPGWSQYAYSMNLDKNVFEAHEMLDKFHLQCTSTDFPLQCYFGSHEYKTAISFGAIHMFHQS